MVKTSRALRRLLYLCKASFLILLLFLPVPGHTLLYLKTQSPLGEAFFVLKDGDLIKLTWKNSLFGQQVTESFVVEGGILWLEEVRFEDSGYSMEANPQELADLYHTGGAFEVRGVHKPFSRIVFRVGAIGKPRLRIGDKELSLYDEAGFGGAVVLRVRKVRLIYLLQASGEALVHRLLFWLSSAHPGAP